VTGKEIQNGPQKAPSQIGSVIGGKRGRDGWFKKDPWLELSWELHRSKLTFIYQQKKKKRDRCPSVQIEGRRKKYGWDWGSKEKGKMAKEKKKKKKKKRTSSGQLVIGEVLTWDR